MAIEILKKGDPKKIESWERLHDKRKTYRCERCGCEWKCEWRDNKFGSPQDYNGDPDILCQECGRPTVKEVKNRTIPEREARFMSFGKYCFSVNDVIKGLNEYYSHGFNAEWPFLMIEHGVVNAVRRDKVYFSSFMIPQVFRHEDHKSSFVIICDPAETAIDAVKWLSSVGTVYYPGMNVVSDPEPEPCVQSLRKLMAERNKFGKRLSDIRKAAGMSDGDPTDLVEYISKLKSQRDKYRQNRDKYEMLAHCLRSVIDDIKED